MAARTGTPIDTTRSRIARTDLDLRVPEIEAASLRATLVLRDGKPAWPATVSIFGEASGATAIEGTDRLGCVRFERVPRGRYRIWVDAGSGAAYEVPAREIAGDVDVGTIRSPEVRSVAIRWKTSGDAGVVRATLSFRLELPEGALTRGGGSQPVAGTDAVTLPLFAGRYALRLAGPGVQPFTRIVTIAPTGDASLTLPLRAATARTIVPRFAGDAPRSARVRVLDDDGLVWQTLLRGGALSVPLVPGRYRLEADVAVATIETLRGEFEVPAENAPERFDVPVR